MTAQFVSIFRTNVAPERLSGWLDRFRTRHGQLSFDSESDALWLHAADGARARLINLWEPWLGDGPDCFVEQLKIRTIAILLVRKGADAVAVASGTELVAHRTSTHYVQGRTKAGGWSQQRYARRRQQQATRAYQRAADDAFEVLLPQLAALSALVTGGDRVGIAEVLGDPRLAPLAALPQRHRLLDSPEARLSVLTEAARTARAVPIELDALACASGDGSAGS